MQDPFKREQEQAHDKQKSKTEAETGGASGTSKRYSLEAETTIRFVTAAGNLVEEVISWQYNCNEIEEFIDAYETFKRMLKSEQSNAQ